MSSTQALLLLPKHRTVATPLLTFLLGVCTTLLGVWAANLGAAGQPSSRAAVGQEKVDFSFQILGINTTRQLNKTMDVFVRWRYPHNSDCPWSGMDNCIQYQKKMHSTILDIATRPTPDLPLAAEWERVNLAICRRIWSGFSDQIAALTTTTHVNGDGRSAAARGRQPYEPGAHGSTCTIGDIEPLFIPNRLQNLGAP